MIKKAYTYIAFFMALALLFSFTVSANESNYISYTYNSKEKVTATPNPYSVKKLINTQLGLSEPRDFQVNNGKIYILDSGNNRIVILNDNYNFEKEIKIKKDGEEYTTGELTSLWVDGETILIVDRVSEQVLRTDKNGNIIFTYIAPENDASDSDKNFMPCRVVTDQTGYLYINLENEYRGLMVLDANGNFVTYYGSADVAVTADYIATSFWRRFMNEEQISATSQYIPGGYNSITTNGTGFIFAVKGLSSETDELICKLNPGGDNVLSYKGHFGDYNLPSGKRTEFLDIAVDECGFIATIDKQSKRIFEYSPDGNLLYAFGGSAEKSGFFSEPVAIDYSGDDLIVLDKLSSSLTVFKKESFAHLVHKALNLYNNAEFKNAGKVWREVLSEDGNYELALVGLGKVAEAEKNYTSALTYYRNGGSKINYSSALYKYRVALLRKNFSIIIITLAIIFIAIYIIIRKRRKNKISSRQGPSSKFKYMLYCFLHPFDGFGELRYNNNGSEILGIALALIWFFVSCLNYNYNGYIFNTDNPENFNMLIVFGSTVGLIFLLVLCNWLLSTFFEGKGTFKNLWVGVSYSLMPIIISSVLSLLFTNVLTMEEAFFVSVVKFIGVLWTVALIFIATSRINQYNFGKNAVVLICSVVGILIIVFLVVLFSNLWVQFMSFCKSVYQEIFYRIQVV